MTLCSVVIMASGVSVGHLGTNINVGAKTQGVCKEQFCYSKLILREFHETIFTLMKEFSQVLVVRVAERQTNTRLKVSFPRQPG